MFYKSKLEYPIITVTLVILIQLILQGCTSKGENQEILAEIGDRQITLEEFRLFYELDPNFGIDSSGFPALRDELHYYLDQIRSGKLAENEGLIEDEIFKKAIDWEKRQAMLRQLFREVVLEGIEVSEEELRRAYKTENIQVNVRHLFSPEEKQVLQWAKRIREGEEFGDIARETFNDSILSENGGNLGWVRLGDLDNDFAASVSGLKPGELSGPVKTRWGYHLIELLDRKDAVILSEEEYKRSRPRLVKKIHKIKRDLKSAEYISSYLGRLNPQPVQSTFLLLWNALAHNSAPGGEKTTDVQYSIMLSSPLIDDLQQQLQDYLDETLIFFKSGSITLGEYLEGMKSVPAGQTQNYDSPADLSDQMGRWVRDELLYQKAVEHNLQDNERVRHEVQRYKEEQSYYYYLNAILDTLSTPPEIQRYFESGPSEGLNLSRFQTLETWRWKRAEGILKNQLRTFHFPVSIDRKMLREESERIPWGRTIRMFRVRRPS